MQYGRKMRVVIPKFIRKLILRINPILLCSDTGLILPLFYPSVTIGKIITKLLNCNLIFYLYIDSIDLIEEIFIKEVYEHGLKINKGDIIIDVGAHVGLFSIKIAKKVGKSGLVFAIEPVKSNLDLLKRNCDINEVRNIIIIPKAVGSQVGHTKFYITDCSATHSSSLYYLQKHKKKVKKIIDVEMIRIDDIVEKFKLEKIDLIKIDAEGLEVEILKGAEKALTITKQLVISAYHTTNEAEEIKNFLKERGFLVWINNGICYARRL